MAAVQEKPFALALPCVLKRSYNVVQHKLH